MSNRFAALASESSGEGQRKKLKAEVPRKRKRARSEERGQPLAEGTEKSLPGGVTIKAGCSWFDIARNQRSSCLLKSF